MADDLPLLIHVSDLSGRLPHDVHVAMPVRQQLLRFGLVIAALALTPAANAEARKQEEVRRAVERGEIRSLADALGAMREKVPGQVVGVEIEHENGGWRYEFCVVDSKGRVFEVYVDARTSEIGRIKEK
jgi:uncharacterized membrane protein YkoI